MLHITHLQSVCHLYPEMEGKADINNEFEGW